MGCSGISWTICKQSAPHSRQITTPTPHHSISTGWMLFLTPNQQCQSTGGKTTANFSDYLSGKIAQTSRSVNFFLTTCTSAEQCDYRYTRTAGQTDGKHIAHMTADADITMAKLYSTTPNHKLHIHPFNGLLSRTTRVSQYQKGKTNLDFTEARDSEWQWHQLGHMQVCTSLQTDNHADTPPGGIFTGRNALPAAQPTASKH